MRFYIYLFFILIFCCKQNLSLATGIEDKIDDKKPLVLRKEGYLKYTNDKQRYVNQAPNQGFNQQLYDNKPQKKSYEEFLKQRSVYQGQNSQAMQPSQGLQQQNQPIPQALMPQNNVKQFQQSQNSESLKRKQQFANNMKNGFEFNIYTDVAGGSGKNDFRLPTGWNVIRVSPDITGDNSPSISTSSNLNNTYQNIRDNQAFNSKLMFANIGIFARLKLPSFFSNDLQIFFEIITTLNKAMNIKSQ